MSEPLPVVVGLGVAAPAANIPVIFHEFETPVNPPLTCAEILSSADSNDL